MSNGGGKGKEARSRWETVTAAVGMLALLALLGFLAYQALWVDDQPPQLHVQLDSITASPGAYAVHFLVRNQGTRAAASVVVGGSLDGTGGNAESGNITFDFVPAGGTRQGALLFRQDPRSFPLELRVLGYRQP